MLQLRLFCKKAVLSGQIQVEVNGWIDRHPSVEVIEKEVRIHKSDDGEDDIYVILWYNIPDNNI